MRGKSAVRQQQLVGIRRIHLVLHGGVRMGTQLWDVHGICGDGMRKGAERYDDGNTHLDTCGGELECGGPVDSCEGGCGLGQRTTCSSNECDNGNLVAGGRMQRIMPDQVRLGMCRGESRQRTCAFQQGAGTRCWEGRRSAGRRQ